jgi:translocation and assembly module TamB
MADQPAAPVGPPGEHHAADDSAAAAEEVGENGERGLRRRVGGRLMGAGAWTLVALLLLVTALVYVAGRTVTLQWAAQQAVSLSDGRLQIEGITGSVLSEVAADSVRWHDGGIVVTVTAPRFTYQPFALLDGLIRIDRISASEIVVALPSPAQEPRQPIRLPGALAAMLPIAIDRLDASRVVVQRGGQDLAKLYNLEAVFRHDGDRIIASLLNLDLFADGARIGMRGEASVLARAPFATDGRLTVQVPLQPQALRMDVRLNGPIQELAVRATTTFAGAPIEARTVLHPLDPRPLRQVRLEVKDLDLARYDARLPGTRLSGTYEAEVMPAWASESKPLLIGPMNLTNAIAGPLDRRRIPVTAAKAVVGYLEGRLEVQTLQASGPIGELAGDGWMGGGSFRLALSSERLQLRAINSSLKPRLLAAKVAVEPIEAIRAGTGQSAASPKHAAKGSARFLASTGLSLTVEARDPSLAAEMKAALVDGRLRISRAQVQLRPTRGGMATVSGMASFSGDVGMAAPWPVDLAGSFRNFDPGQLTAMPPAVLNGKWRLGGRVAGGDGEGLKAEVRLADSKLRNLPLAGSLAANLALKDFELRRVSGVAASLRWGASTVDALGALGDPADALRITIDLPKASELQTGMDGALRGQASLRGSLAEPSMEGTLEGRGLAATAGGLRTSAATASMQLRTTKAQPGAMELRARLEDVAVRQRVAAARSGDSAAPMLRFGQIVATADGRLQEHAVRVEAGGHEQHLVLAATGSLDADGLWHGSVSRLDASSPALRMQPVDPATGAVDLQSLQPFAISAGAGYISGRDARFLIHGALLNLRSLDWQGPVLSVRADAAGIPARWLDQFVGIGTLLRVAGPAEAPAGAAAAAAAAEPAHDAAHDSTHDSARASGGAADLRHDLRLTAAVDFRGSPADAGAGDWRGVLQVRRGDGDLAIADPAGGAPLRAGLKKFEASASIDARVLKLVANVDGDNIGWMSAEAQVPLQARGEPVWSNAVLARSPLSGRVQMATSSFRWIAPPAGEHWRVDGALSARLQLAGTLIEPRAEGVITGNDLSAREPTLGLHLTNGLLAADVAGDRIDVRLLRFASGDGSVAISGVAQAPEHGRSQARIILDRLAIPLGPAQQVVVSGSTVATLQAGTLGIAGRLVADEGNLDLGADERAASRSGTGGRAEPAGLGGLAIGTDLEVDLGRLFRVSGSGIDANLGGVIRLGGSLPDAIRATGAVDLLHGVFEVDGRRLRIKRGRVVFDGPLAEPSLDIVAIREHLKVEAGIAMSGKAVSPVVDLVSEPQVDEADQLSWLMLGAAAGDAPRARDLTALQAAGAEAREAMATLGRRLGTQLAAVYEQSLAGVWNILKLQYEVTGRLAPGAIAVPLAVPFAVPFAPSASPAPGTG